MKIKKKKQAKNKYKNIKWNQWDNAVNVQICNMK